MPNYTKNLKLIKPKKNENYDIEIANTNNEIIDTAIESKVEKIVGKGLSANDFTNSYKQKVDRLVSGAKGDSAYEIAIRNGYEGTEEEYLEHLKGATFTPAISEGVLSWTNNKNLPNPEPFNLHQKIGNSEMFEWNGKSSTEDATVLTLFSEIMELVNNNKTVFLIVPNKVNINGQTRGPFFFILNKENEEDWVDCVTYYSLLDGAHYLAIDIYMENNQISKVEPTWAYTNEILRTTNNSNSYFRAEKKSQPVSSGFLDEKIGDIATILDNLNGEAI